MKAGKIQRWSPAWWHDHGGTMSVKEFDLKKKILVLGNNAAKLTIKFLPQKSHLEGDCWEVSWEVMHIRDEGEKGMMIFPPDYLREAFNLKSSSESTNFLFTQYGAEAGRQRYFIRYKEFLNIPCPGTGNDGDPNISIFVSDRIKAAVKKLLK